VVAVIAVALVAVARAVVVTSGPVAVVVSVALAMMERTVDQAVSRGGQGEMEIGIPIVPVSVHL
jgi:hypothetical protein